MKAISLCSLIILTVFNVAQSEEVYLEGISMLGTKKNAFLSMNGGKMTVNEGDIVGHWHVTHIDQDSVLLATEEGKETELLLYSQFILHETHSEDPTTKTLILEKIPQPPAQPTTTYTPPIIVDADVPVGHRKVHTPFGDFLIKEREDPVTVIEEFRAAKLFSSQLSQEESSVITDDEIPPGHRRVRTPFGDVLVKDKPTKTEQ